MDIFNTILKWPVIIQGALGSGLFWLLLLAGQVFVDKLSAKLNKDKQTGRDVALLARAESNRKMAAEAFFSCLYGSLHYFIKAMIVIVLALLISPINHVISIVGYLISVYFLFRALSWVPHFDTFGTMEEAKEKLKKLDEEYTANKKINKDT